MDSSDALRDRQTGGAPSKKPLNDDPRLENWRGDEPELEEPMGEESRLEEPLSNEPSPDHLKSAGLRLDPAQREHLWARLVGEVERHWENVDRGRVTPALDPVELRSRLTSLSLEDGLPVDAAMDFVVDGLTNDLVHTTHRRYFGLFNPAPATLGVVADTLVAAFNPQLAAWSHSPFACEVERHLVKELGKRFGYPADTVDGVFASGGAEANHTAVLTALVRALPAYRESGIPDSGRPTMYVTTETHDSLRKAASLAGIGFQGVRRVPTDRQLKMDVEALASAIATDRANGYVPFLVVGTAGTTSAGIIDPLEGIRRVADESGMWFHVDAAWGGAAALSKTGRPFVAGIQSADSITFDAHKWLSVPMGAGIFLTRHPTALASTFGTDNAYMPREAAGLDVVDPFSVSMQWSRRFIGLKLFMTLAVTGWAGYSSLIDRQIELGEMLKQLLRASDWDIVNETPLPIVCAVDRLTPDADRSQVDALVRRIVRQGSAWVSSAVLGNGRACLRACITNFRTDESDLQALVNAMNATRQA